MTLTSSSQLLRLSSANQAARVCVTCLLLAFGTAGAAWAQLASDAPDWKESEVPSPPVFDMGQLVTFDGEVNSSLVYGVDPASIRISGQDGVVRYVIVAASASGAKNVMYEAIRCSTGEFKTYARYSSDGLWSPVSDANWRPMLGGSPSKHALYFARAGGCDYAAPPSSVSALVFRLKNPNLK